MQSGDNAEVTTTQSSKMSRLDYITETLSDWKEFLIVAQNVFLWKKTYYSYCIAGFTTVIFIFWWWLDATVLSTLASLLFTLVIADYIIPSIGSKLLGDITWEVDQETQFNGLCQQILDGWDRVLRLWEYARTRKATHPKTYIAVVCVGLLVVGLVGSVIDNTLLCYILVLLLAMLPGATHRGLVALYYGKACQQIQKLLNQKPKPKEQ